MGWVFYHRPTGQSDREHFAQEFSTFRNGDCEFVETASKNGVFYAAVRTLKSNGYTKAGEVWALVILMQRTRSEYNFGYKDMDENMGPTDCGAPARVLDALTPTSNEWALEWREKCRARLAKQERVKRDVKPGAIIELDREVSFGDSRQVSVFEYRPQGRRATWWALDKEHQRLFLCRLGADWAFRYGWTLVKTP